MPAVVDSRLKATSSSSPPRLAGRRTKSSGWRLARIDPRSVCRSSRTRQAGTCPGRRWRRPPQSSCAPSDCCRSSGAWGSGPPRRCRRGCYRRHGPRARAIELPNHPTPGPSTPILRLDQPLAYFPARRSGKIHRRIEPTRASCDSPDAPQSSRRSSTVVSRRIRPASFSLTPPYAAAGLSVACPTELRILRIASPVVMKAMRCMREAHPSASSGQAWDTPTHR